MRMTVCELPDERAAFDDAWTQLARHVHESASELVLLPDMPFCRRSAGGRRLERSRWIKALRAHDAWEQKLPELSPARVLGSRPVDFGNRSYDEGYAWDAEHGLFSVHARAHVRGEDAGDDAWFLSTPEFTPVEIDGLRLGFLIGTELWAEDEARRYGQERIDILAMPRSGGAEAFAEWLDRARRAASLAGACVLSSNRSGAFGGQGWIIDPEGEVLGVTNAENPFLTLDVLLPSERSRPVAPQPSPAYIDPLETGVPPYP